MTTMRSLLRALPLMAVMGTMLGAQVPAHDPSDRLRELLPTDVAERVLERIAEARNRELPPQAVAALEHRALKFAARGVAPVDVERAIGEHADRMLRARSAIESARPERAGGEEIDAGAEAIRLGVDGAAVSELARSAPSGRSLTVPLFVLGSLVERGLASDDALARVRERLMGRASDREIEGMAGRGRGRGEDFAPPVRPADRPGATGRPGDVPAAGRRPVVPAPTDPGRPATPNPRRP